jgi:excisionase family DNA binding protein
MKELSIVEAAEYLGVSRRKVWKLVKQRLLHSRRCPLDERKKLIRLDDLERIKNHRN